MNSGEFKNKTLVGYAATSQDITTSENSSSGGIFALIAREFLRNNSWVIGAKMESDYCLKHVAINHIEELEGLQGSKYVQSNMDGIIDKISELLSNGSQVLFSGTPCQVSGLKKAMKIKGIDVKNLVTIDIVCHGVPSPKFFREHVKFKYGKVSNIKFRHRTKHELNGYALGFQKSGNYKIIQPTNRDFYYKPIVTLLFGDEYSNSSMILAPLCLWFVLSVVNNFLGIQILVASGHQKEYSNAFLISAVMSIVLYFILGKLLGMFGIAFATFFAELALTILLLIRVIKI